jgi:hypothetical protein
MIFILVLAPGTQAKMKKSESVIEGVGEEFSHVNLKKGINFDDIDEIFTQKGSGRSMRGIPPLLYFNSFSTRISIVLPRMIFR